MVGTKKLSLLIIVSKDYMVCVTLILVTFLSLVGAGPAENFEIKQRQNQGIRLKQILVCKKIIKSLNKIKSLY
jgi:hypothetical protein